MKITEAFDDWLFENKPAGLVVVGKRKRTLSTRVGDRVIWRRLYRRATKGGGKRGRFLIDEQSNIQPRCRVAFGLRKIMVAMATRLSYREAAKVLGEAGFRAINHTTVHKEARRYRELQQNSFWKQEKHCFKEVKQGADGVMINLVP